MAALNLGKIFAGHGTCRVGIIHNNEELSFEMQLEKGACEV